MKSMAMRREVQAYSGLSNEVPEQKLTGLPILSSGVLFAGSSEVVIAHGTEIYRLRLTRQNRLILTK